jgi:hypothetical protein
MATKVMATCWVTFAQLAVAGCAGGGRFGELAEADQKLFFRCSNAIQPARCGDDKDTVYVTICLRDAQAEYAEERARAGRHRWLASYGCPPSMIEPERLIAEDPGTSPPPPPRAVRQKSVILRQPQPATPPPVGDSEDPPTGQ